MPPVATGAGTTCFRISKRPKTGRERRANRTGSDAFLTTSPMSERPAACRAIIAAAEELGLEYRADVNNLPPGAGDSIGWCQQTRGGRRRASAARTYLKPATKRPNLQVITGALVHRVVFDGTRAVARRCLPEDPRRVASYRC